MCLKKSRHFVPILPEQTEINLKECLQELQQVFRNCCSQENLNIKIVFDEDQNQAVIQTENAEPLINFLKQLPLEKHYRNTKGVSYVLFKQRAQTINPSKIKKQEEIFETRSGVQ